MNKNRIIFLSTVFSILSLIYIVLTYYGITRQVQLNYSSGEFYINEYSKLDKIDLKNRVVVCIDTSMNRLDNIKPTILSILDQTVKVDEIALNIVDVDNTTEIPVYLSQTVKIYNDKTQKGVFVREREADTVIIMLNDHTIYSKDYIEVLYDKFKSQTGILYDKNGTLFTVDMMT